MTSAKRFDQIQTPVIPVMAKLIAANPGTLSLGQGVAPWAPPAEVIEAIQAALCSDPDLHRYGPVAGDPELRIELQHWLEQQHQIDCSASEILITAGSNMAFQAVVQALCDPGDEVILPIPYYFNHEMAVRIAGGIPKAIEAGVIPDPDQLEQAITERTRAIVTVSPNNPSGAIFPRPVLEAINQLCARRGLIHISDEAYGLFHYGGERPWSPGAASGSGSHTISLGSLSKSHGMAGYRIGWAVVPPGLMSALTKVQDTSLIGPPKLNQWAARAALGAGAQWCKEQIGGLAERREQVLQAFNGQQPGRLLCPPEGAFYALVQVQCALSTDQLMERLIREHQVALASGSSFGLKGACLRLSYGTLSGEDLAEALQRLQRGLLALT
ncbi:aminotransferase class I/II-fold pyridoxal phosphate-dependent enzyme [Synechococcus sp. W4D4]|uniref:aminotransferase class I/II-fold pyridoxal phosphate-dependent enzyme n=1 Tax=Synechococcus sp. W4D4 TaxID=3392294 RepID=UPI0039E8CC74